MYFMLAIMMALQLVIFYMLVMLGKFIAEFSGLMRTYQNINFPLLVEIRKAVKGIKDEAKED